MQQSRLSVSHEVLEYPASRCQRCKMPVPFPTTTNLPGLLLAAAAAAKSCCTPTAFRASGSNTHSVPRLVQKYNLTACRTRLNSYIWRKKSFLKGRVLFYSHYVLLNHGTTLLSPPSNPRIVVFSPQAYNRKMQKRLQSEAVMCNEKGKKNATAGGLLGDSTVRQVETHAL